MDVGRKEEKEEEEFKMEIKVLNKKDNELKFEISGINEVEANTLRRIMITETPTLAIEEVEIMKNDSGLYDEVLANRMGLVPLITDLKTYNLPENCTCKEKGCAKCQTQATIEFKGPKTVYSGDLSFQDPNIKASYKKMPIVKLLENQELEIIATAKLGKGKGHIKHAPAAVFYTNKPILKINNDSKKLDKSKFPKEALKDGRLDEVSLLKNNLYESCEGIEEDVLKVEYEKDKFIFNIESFGQLNTKDILEAGVNSLNSKLDDFTKALKESKTTAIKTLAKKITG